MRCGDCNDNSISLASVLGDIYGVDRYHVGMARTVGRKDRSEFILEPAEALRRGRVLDRMLSAATPRRTQSVLRATHGKLNALDDQRLLEIARRLNAG